MRAASFVLVFAVGCSSSSVPPEAADAELVDASAPDANVAESAALDDSSPVADASDDAASEADVAIDAGPTTLTVFPPVGEAGDVSTKGAGAGLILMGGGTDVDDAFRWAHGRVGDGDVVVLRATGTNAYDAYIAGLAKFHSVRTILLPPPSTPADLAIAASYVDRAEFVFFAGGNQADYVRWKGAPLGKAVAGVIARGGVVGGTSAGCAIQGQFVYDAIAAGSTNVQSSDALDDPFEAPISFTRDMFAWPMLAGVITDPHFHQRDRFGRLASFMARQIADGAAKDAVVGVGVDEGNALVVDDHGVATLKQQKSGAAFIVRGGVPDIVKGGEALLYRNLRVERLDADGQTYDFTKRCGNGTTYSVDVDGAHSKPYTPDDPYAASGTRDACK